MPPMIESGLIGRLERVLIATSGYHLLVVFWFVFVVTGACAAVPARQSTAVGVATQLALLLFWVGYPVVIFRCLVEGQRGCRGASLLLGVIILGCWLSVFGATDVGGPVRDMLLPVVGAVLVFSPFVAASVALTNAERRSQMDSNAGVVLTALALFSFPFFGAYVHDRFRRAYLARSRGSCGPGVRTQDR